MKREGIRQEKPKKLSLPQPTKRVIIYSENKESYWNGNKKGSLWDLI